MPTSSPPAPDPKALGALRAALRARFGLSLEGLTGAQLWQARLDAGTDAPEEVFEHLPISESALFRNPQLWEWFEDAWLPGALDATARTGKPLRIVSLGCSHGQEVFSAAALAARALRMRGLPSGSWPSFVEVHGWDGSARRVERAREGLVSAWSVRGGKEAWLAELKPEGQEFRVPAPLRALCRFEQVNLSSELPGPLDDLRGADLVFMQHVLVYFEAPAAARLVEKLVSAVSDRAVLVVAAVESHLLQGKVQPLKGAPVGVAVKGAVQPAPEPRRPVPPPLVQRAAVAVEADPAAGLVERLLTARALMSTDPARGRELLTALVRDCANGAADPQAAVSVEQVAQAARLLLGRAEP